jgi:hypothetical protein
MFSVPIFCVVQVCCALLTWVTAGRSKDKAGSMSTYFADPLESEDFDPVAYINQRFPTGRISHATTVLVPTASVAYFARERCYIRGFLGQSRLFHCRYRYSNIDTRRGKYVHTLFSIRY